MSDKARDLLEDALIWFEATGNCFDLSDEIRAYLAEENKSDANSVALQSRCRGDKG